ncbi:MAG: ABC transporter substrate binding protein, partial [Acidobacteria bacterium]|nr:ABC transporter substrate binding protein [Acidobacteriota bacterium]
MALGASLEGEVGRLLGGRYKVLFPSEKQLVGDWSAASARHNIEGLLGDSEIDAVLVIGIVGPAYVTRRAEIPKPVVAAVVLDPENSGIPVETREQPLRGREGVKRFRVSGVSNLSYVSYNQDLTRELEMFREIAPFARRLTILMIEGWLEELAAVLERLKQTFRGMGFETTFLPVGASVDETLESLPENTEAVMLGGMPHLSSEEFEQLIAGLTERKLPTYSLRGQRDVQRGVMAGLQADRNTLYLVRRVALNLFNLVQGEDAAELPVDLSVEEQLTINMTNARAVQIDPTFALLTEADLIGETEEPSVRRVSLSSVVREAASANLDFIAAGQRVEAGFQLVREARSAVWPQASVSSQGSVFQGIGRQIAGAAGISQLVYSEQARSIYDVERQLQKSRGEQRVQLRLDTILQGAQGYLDILRAKTIREIEKTNLRLTRSNLRIARTRVDVGRAGRDEVLRWRSQIAQNRRRVIDAWAGHNRAKIVLNRILNRRIEEPFETAEAGLDDPELTVNFQVLKPYITSPRSFRLFREFMTREALDGSPELRHPGWIPSTFEGLENCRFA